ncbi:hypothetical protein D3C81_1571800 [compost metagenome]
MKGRNLLRGHRYIVYFFPAVVCRLQFELTVEHASHCTAAVQIQSAVQHADDGHRLSAYLGVQLFFDHRHFPVKGCQPLLRLPGLTQKL